MKTRVLVPLDGSRAAEQALPYAVSLSKALPAELLLFRAIAIPSEGRKVPGRTGLEPGTLIDKLEAEASEYLRSVARRMLSDTHLDVNYVVQRGQAVDAISDFARQPDIGLIVMASRGHRGIKRRNHSSVAERVLHAATVPVLLVHTKQTGSADQKPGSCRRILVPLDGSKMAEQALKPATAIAQILDCELVLFEASVAFLFEFSTRAAGRMAQRYLKGVADRLQDQGIDVSIAVQTGPVVETIAQFARSNDIDLIAMCTHGRTGLARWALGSVADRVLRAGNTPVFMVRAT